MFALKENVDELLKVFLKDHEQNSLRETTLIPAATVQEQTICNDTTLLVPQGI